MSLLSWFTQGELACPVCGSKLDVSVESHPRAKERVDLTRRFRERQLSEREFAAATGAVADRTESTDASVDNAVYRAWQEMTDLLDLPNPESSTSGEFADAAVEAGMGEEDVNQLTRLFEEVRYGDMDPEPREDLALETLRGIEERSGVGSDEQDISEQDAPDDAPRRRGR